MTVKDKSFSRVCDFCLEKLPESPGWPDKHAVNYSRFMFAIKKRRTDKKKRKLHLIEVVHQQCGSLFSAGNLHLYYQHTISRTCQKACVVVCSVSLMSVAVCESKCQHDEKISCFQPPWHKRRQTLEPFAFFADLCTSFSQTPRVQMGGVFSIFSTVSTNICCKGKLTLVMCVSVAQ